MVFKHPLPHIFISSRGILRSYTDGIPHSIRRHWRHLSHSVVLPGVALSSSISQSLSYGAVRFCLWMRAGLPGGMGVQLSSICTVRQSASCMRSDRPSSQQEVASQVWPSDQPLDCLSYSVVPVPRGIFFTCHLVHANCIFSGLNMRKWSSTFSGGGCFPT